MFRLYIIGNEKIHVKTGNYFSANVDFKTIVEGLSKNFKIYLIARLSTKKENFRIKSKGIIVACSNLANYIFQIIFTLKNLKRNKYLIISITPFTFFAYIVIFLFTNKIYVYLRSDGFKEYENILGKKWVFLYQIMFFVMLRKSKIITCQRKLSRTVPSYLVRPSELDEKWFENKKKINLKTKKIKLLYVGRMSIEKGIFNLLNIFAKLENEVELTIVGDKKNKLLNNCNIRFYNFFSKSKYLIDQYDKCHIFILPSYTEAHPKVIDEALARYKPVIIFDDIAHIIGDRLGIFICKRNPEDLKNKISYIYKNYSKIVKSISKNILPTKKVFLEDLNNIIINK
jgi:glycosyltransferase involved in cell wall biosynthesis